MAYRPQILSVSNGGNAPQNLGGPDIISEFDEFWYDGTTANYDLPWGNQSRSGATFQSGTAANPGVWSLRTTTNNNDSQGISKGMPDVGNGAGSVILGGGVMEITWIVQVPTLATGGEDFRCLAGLMQSVNPFGSGDGGTDGVYFYYNTSANANWLCVTRASSTSTTTNSGVAVNTSFVRLTIRVNAAASSITFYINGTLVATNTTNIPTASLGHGAQIQKTAGTTARQFNLDRWQYFQQLTTSRF